ncbi:MAG: 16S rRNA processing protein RimM [Anaerolineae bacterium]|nr:16S rRNA processing protein RimM [Anaerolineae bacterium]
MTDSPAPDKQPSGPQFLILARILRPHGVRGDLSIQVVTDFPERLNDLDTVYLGLNPADSANLTAYEVTWARRAKKDQWLLHLEGVDDRNEAEPLRNQYICVSLADAVPLEADEVYLFQVIGLNVQTSVGEALGRVMDVIETGANDVYVVRGEAYGEILLPAIPTVIRNIDPDAGVMIVDIPAGLLPDNPPAQR